MSVPMSRGVALRIGLVARVYPEVEIKDLVFALTDLFGLPLTEIKFFAFNQQALRDKLSAHPAFSANPQLLNTMVQHLLEPNDFPMVEPYQEGTIPHSVRVAIASNQYENLDGHFGSCERFLIYQVAHDSIHLIDVRLTLETEEAEDRNAARVELIEDCQVLFVQSIGGPAAAKVVRADIHPVKIPEGGAAREILKDLQSRLLTPPPWLAQVMGVVPTSLEPFKEAAHSASQGAAL